MLEFRPGMPLQARGGSRSLSSGPESDPDPDPEQGRHAGKKVRLFFEPSSGSTQKRPVEAVREQDSTGIWERGPGSSRGKKSPMFFQFHAFCQMTREQEGAPIEGVVWREDHSGAREDICSGVPARNALSGSRRKSELEFNQGLPF